MRSLSLPSSSAPTGDSRETGRGVSVYNCARAWAYLRQVQGLHPKRLRLEFKARPRPRYTRATRLAKAVYAARLSRALRGGLLTRLLGR